MGAGVVALRREVWLLRCAMSIGKQVKEKVAAMRHRIVVKYRTTSQDGIGGPEESWTTRFASEPAAYQDVSGGEFIRGRKIDVQTTALFTVNYRTGWTETDVIEWGGVTYGIVSIDKPEGVSRYLEIQAKVAV